MLGSDYLPDNLVDLLRGEFDFYKIIRSKSCNERIHLLTGQVP